MQSKIFYTTKIINFTKFYKVQCTRENIFKVFKVCLKNNSTDPIFDRILVNFRNSKKYVETSLQIS